MSTADIIKTNRVIALCGRSGSGKTMFEKLLCTPDNMPLECMAFADPLKQAVGAIFNWPLERLYVGNREERDEWWAQHMCMPDFSPRRALQLFGTQVGRAIHPDVWVLNLQKRVETALAQGKRVLITDVRFENEAAFVRKTLGGMLIRIERPVNKKCPQHASEDGIDALQVDATIFNNVDVSVFADKIARQDFSFITPTTTPSTPNRVESLSPTL